jgi:hypothetical protein
MATQKSPYLAEGRLADVIAAIQALGTYRFYRLSLEEAAHRIGADRTRQEHWKEVFRDHPEFFRLDSHDAGGVSLVWRRQFPKLFHVDENRLLTFGEFNALTAAGRTRVSRSTLAPGDIKTLMDTAINLHARAVEQSREQRWWVPVVVGFVGIVVGAFISGLLKK